MKKRLVIVHILFSKGFAGTERSTAESCNFQCKDHDVILICSKKNKRSSGASIVKNLDERVKIIKISPRFDVRANVQKILDEFNPHVVHAHLRKSTRVLANCSTSAVKISTLHIGVNGSCFLDMDGLVAISPWQLKTIPVDYRGRAVWIRNSLTPHSQPSDKKKKRLRVEMGCSTSDFLIGGVGRLSYSKGWDVLIDAYKRAKIPNAKLVLIGEGRHKKSFVSKAKGTNIQFLGYKTNVKDYYGAFDVFVCPSREEPMGRVILEALDANTPVIASNIEGPKDMLEVYPGTLVPVDDPVALSRALQEAYDKKDETKEVADLRDHYIDNVGQEMVDLYLSLGDELEHVNG